MYCGYAVDIGNESLQPTGNLYCCLMFDSVNPCRRWQSYSFPTCRLDRCVEPCQPVKKSATSSAGSHLIKSKATFLGQRGTFIFRKPTYLIQRQFLEDEFPFPICFQYVSVFGAVFHGSQVIFISSVSCFLGLAQIGYKLDMAPCPVTVTTRIIPFLVGNPYKPSFVTVTGTGDNPRYELKACFGFFVFLYHLCHPKIHVRLHRWTKIHNGYGCLTQILNVWCIYHLPTFTA